MKYVVRLNQRVYEVEIERADTAAFQNVPDSGAATRGGAAAAFTAAPEQPVAPAPVQAPASGGSETQVESPMPGKVLSIAVQVGQRVCAGESLLVMEAMKMENEIVAPQDGTVKQILVSQGTMVDTGDILTVLI